MVFSETLLLGLIRAHPRTSEPERLLVHFGRSVADLEVELARRSNILSSQVERPRSLSEMPDLSDHAAAAILDAQRLSVSFPWRDRRIHFAHLFGGLLGQRTSVAYEALDQVLSGRVRLGEIADSYIVDFLPGGADADYPRFLQERFPLTTRTADQAQSSVPPQAAAAPTAKRPDVRAGYESDVASGLDLLNFQTEVESLAAVIAARDVQPPLSIGLFGDWGSGKTFFMGELKQTIEELAKRAEEAANPKESAFCSNVVQINFNAWHYVGANLWASLAARVFEGLAEGIANRSRESDEEVRRLIGEANVSGALLQAAQARRLALAQRRLQLEQEKSDLLERRVDAVVLAATDVEQGGADLRAALRTPSGDVKVAQVREAQQDLQHAATRVWRGFQELPGRARARAFGKILLALAAVAVIVAGLIGLQIAGWFGATVGGLLGAVLTLFLSAERVGSSLLRAVDKVIESEEGKVELNKVRAAEKEAENDVKEADERYRQTAAAAEQAERVQAATIYRFIEDRYSSDDYRKLLGVVSLIQTDFATLSQRLAVKDGESAAEPRVERIVLYIDDLDRCPPELVVQVLQAVHLLLAFKLFVVVVGVDSRWLLRSLQTRYGELLEQSPDGHSKEDAAYWSATPLSYLEKIFQIPYWIRPMDQTGYEQLIRDVVPVARTGTSTAADAMRAPSRDVTASAATADRGERLPAQALADRAMVQGTASQPARRQLALDTKQIEVDERERKFMEGLWKLIPTPRAAKRMANVYRLLRVTVQPRDRDRWITPEGGDYQAVQLLLAIVTGFPSLAVDIFPALEKTSSGSWPQFLEMLSPTAAEDVVDEESVARGETKPLATRANRQHGNPRATVFRSVASDHILPQDKDAWDQLRVLLEEVSVASQDIGPFKKWAPRVGRYSFQVGRALTNPDRAAQDYDPAIE